MWNHWSSHFFFWYAGNRHFSFVLHSFFCIAKPVLYLSLPVIYATDYGLHVFSAAVQTIVLLRFHHWIFAIMWQFKFIHSDFFCLYFVHQVHSYISIWIDIYWSCNLSMFAALFWSVRIHVIVIILIFSRFLKLRSLKRLKTRPIYCHVFIVPSTKKISSCLFFGWLAFLF